MSELKGNDSVYNNANSDVNEDVPGNLDSTFDPIVESLNAEINVLKIKMASRGKINQGFAINLKKCEKEKSDSVKQVDDC